MILKNRKEYLKMALASVVLLITFIYLIAVTQKIPYGGYWSIVIATITLFIILLWISGMSRMRKYLRSVTLDVFTESFKQIYQTGNFVKGEALFFTKSTNSVSPYILHCMFRTGIMYEKNVLVSVENTDQPYGVKLDRNEEISPGLFSVRILYGYMEVPDLPKLFKVWGFNEKAIFYGAEEIKTNKVFLKLFIVLKKIAPNWISYFDFPYNRLHGVVTRIEI